MRTLLWWSAVSLLLVCIGCGGTRQIGPPPPQCTGLITGTLIANSTGAPPPSNTAFVMLEQQRPGVWPFPMYVPLVGGKPKPDGTFQLCAGAGTYALVAAGLDANGLAYPPAITTQIVQTPTGVGLGDVFLGLSSTPPAAPATLSGEVSTSTGTAAAPATVAISLQHFATDASGGQFGYLLPITPDSGWTLALATQNGAACSAGTACASYNFSVPSLSPTVRRFGDLLSVQAATAPTYMLQGSALVGPRSNQPNCTPSALFTIVQQNGQPLAATPSAGLTPSTLAFTGCQ